MKKTLLSSLAILTLVSVTACGTPANQPQTNSNIPSDAQFVKVDVNGKTNLDANKPVVYVADMSNTKNGVKGGASFSVKINFPEDGFKTKASSSGSNTASIQAFRVNLCTDNTKPFNTRVLSGTPDGIVLTRSGLTSGTAAPTVMFTNVGSGTYYATVAAFNISAGSVPASAILSEGIVVPDNGGTPYASPDTNARIAVSTNSAIVNSTNLALTFSPSTPSNLTVNANIEVKGASVDTIVTPTDNGSVGTLTAS